MYHFRISTQNARKPHNGAVKFHENAEKILSRVAVNRRRLTHGYQKTSLNRWTVQKPQKNKKKGILAIFCENQKK